MQEMIKQQQKKSLDQLKKEGQLMEIEAIETIENSIKDTISSLVILLPMLRSPDCIKAGEALICKLEDASGAGLEMLEDY